MEVTVRHGWHWGPLAWARAHKFDSLEPAVALAQVKAHRIGWAMSASARALMHVNGVWFVTRTLPFGLVRFVEVERQHANYRY